MRYFQMIVSNWRRYFVTLLVGGVLLLNQGCTKYATTGEALYKQSRNGPMLVVPPPLTQDNISSFYVLPNPGNQAG